MPCICHIYKETSKSLQASSVLEEYPKIYKKRLSHFEDFNHLLAKFLILIGNKFTNQISKCYDDKGHKYVLSLNERSENYYWLIQVLLPGWLKNSGAETPYEYSIYNSLLPE